MINTYALLTAKAEEIYEIQAVIKDKIAMDLKVIGFEGMDWFQLATGSRSIKGRELYDKLCNLQLLRDSAPLNWLRVFFININIIT